MCLEKDLGMRVERDLGMCYENARINVVLDDQDQLYKNERGWSP